MVLLFASPFPAFNDEVALFLAVPAEFLGVRDGRDGEVRWRLGGVLGGITAVEVNRSQASVMALHIELGEGEIP